MTISTTSPKERLNKISGSITVLFALLSKRRPMKKIEFSFKCVDKFTPVIQKYIYRILFCDRGPCRLSRGLSIKYKDFPFIKINRAAGKEKFTISFHRNYYNGAIRLTPHMDGLAFKAPDFTKRHFLHNKNLILNPTKMANTWEGSR